MPPIATVMAMYGIYLNVRNKMELTDEQIDRQDLVDNAIFSLLNEIIPSKVDLNWDIELIGNVRDCIQREFTERNICSAQEFYPEIAS